MFNKAMKQNQPKFQENQIVKIKTKEAIMRTIDKDNKLDGSLFMAQMFNYCGQEYKIWKIIKNFYMGKMIAPISPLYILHDLRCEGISESFDYRCDRTCNLIWHESWLEEI